MIKRIIMLSALSLCLHAEAKDSVHVIKAVEHQTMDGFGASDAWSFWQIGTWADSIQTQVADWLFSLENDENGKPKGIGLSIWRFNAGAGSASQGDSAKINYDTRTEYFGKQTGQRRFLQHAKERGVPTFLAFYNTPPVYLTKNGLGTNTGRGGTFNLREDAYDDFAIYIADMIQTAEREDGIHFSYVCPVNEPDGHWNWQGPKQEGSPATNREIARLTRELSSEFLRRGITTNILINESSDYRCLFATHQTDWRRGYAIQAFWNPDSTYSYIGNLPNVAPLVAAHSYWTNTPVLVPSDKKYNEEGLYAYRKRVADEIDRVNEYRASKGLVLSNTPNGNLAKRLGFWMTELCIMGNDEEIHGGGGFDFSMEEALYVARVMHYDITVGQARSWQWWRAAGGNYKDGLLRMYRQGERAGSRGGRRLEPVRQNMVRDSKLMWTLGNYSRFVRPGAVRLEVTDDTDPKGVMVSAYKNTDGSIAVVAINYSDKPQKFSLKFDASLDVNVKNAKAYRTSDVEGESLLPVPVGKEIPARSVTTFLF